MIFPITLFVLSWICFFIFADKKKYFLFAPTCYVALIFGLASDILVLHYPFLWDYPAATKGPLLLKHLMDDFGAIFVFTYLFLQTLPKKQTIIMLSRHIFYWTLIGISIELIAFKTGNFKYGPWWNLGYSFVADVIFLFVFYGYYKLHKKYTEVSPPV